MAFDEEYDVTKPLLDENLLGGCKLSTYADMIERVRGERDFSDFYSIYGSFFETSEGTEGRMMRDSPPIIFDRDYEIWKKLDSIEKTIVNLFEKRSDLVSSGQKSTNAIDEKEE